ncbi:VWA domain-containing protein [Deinococcus sp. A31D244]|uniref:VWA domain-containing protein n=1 Tax=Deinococcus sp. A31D244 TaxID=3397675 RepID=UPI0039E00C80
MTPSGPLPDAAPLFPLSAVAHQPDLTLALSLLAVSPALGGLLIRGDRGAAKSTSARALAALLPAHADGTAPFVNLPLGAGEERVVGTLDLDAALRGEARLKPGLIAQAHGGVLYIDEVNLLPDHLVDVLLDAAAMGVHRVERDGLSVTAPARFALVGSMNPEEGSLRPQFLDRFGLCVDVQAPTAPGERAEIVRRRLAFDADPAAFTRTWAGAEADLHARLGAARGRLAHVTVPDALLIRIADHAAAAGVRSLRADLVLYRAACALAALEGRPSVTAADVDRAAPLVLTHRRVPHAPDLPPPPPPPTEPPQPPADPPGDAPDGEPRPENESPHTPDAPDGGDHLPPAGDPPGEVFAPAPAHVSLPLPGGARGAGDAGRPRVTGSRPDANPARLALPDSLRAALTRAGLSGEAGPDRPALTRADLRAPILAPHEGNRVLFVADASGSVGASGRMGAVKGALLDALSGPGQPDRAALITFRGVGAALLLDWTADAHAAARAVEGAPTGGRTPLTQALRLARVTLDAGRGARLVLFTDGRANVPTQPGADPWAEALGAARALHGVPALVVDTEAGRVRLGRAAQLARAMGADLAPLHLPEHHPDPSLNPSSLETP